MFWSLSMWARRAGAGAVLRSGLSALACLACAAGTSACSPGGGDVESGGGGDTGDAVEEGPIGQSEDPLYERTMWDAYNPSTPKKSVVIVGGGASGMTAAWHLRRLGHTVTLLEKGSNSKEFGNVKTQYVNVPGLQGPDGKRWVDMGVNDFNTSTYRYITFMLDYLGVKHLPLQDKAMFSNTSGRWFVAGPYDQPWTCSPALAADCDSIRLDMKRFFTYAQEVTDKYACRNITVDEYVRARIPSCLPSTAGPNPGDPPVPGGPYSEAFINYNLKPRISNMYFTNLRDPGNMPLRYVMSYYVLQEGLGKPDVPDSRRYWENGASEWLIALRDKQLLPATPNPPFPGVPYGYGPPVNIQLGATVTGLVTNQAGASPVRVTYTQGGVTKYADAQEVVMATDPAGMQAIFNTTCGTAYTWQSARSAGTVSCPTGQIDNTMFDAIMKIANNTSKSVVHNWNDAAVQTGSYENIAAQRTYNIFIYDDYVDTWLYPPPSTDIHPYTIHYIENFHQNDAASALYDRTPPPGYSLGAQWPRFYTTLERDFGPQQRLIPGYYKIATWDNDTHTSGGAAEWVGKHIITDPQLVVSQQTVLGNHYDRPGVQGAKHVYVGAGWIRFAGLHEELFVHTKNVAAQIDDPAHFYDEDVYNEDPSAPRHAPLYIAQIFQTQCTASGTYNTAGPAPAVNTCLETFDFPTTVNPPPPAGQSSYSSYVAVTGTHVGEPYFNVSGDVASVTPIDNWSLKWNPTRIGSAQLCTGIENGALDTAWDFKVNPKLGGTSATTGYDYSGSCTLGGTKLVFQTIKGTTYQVTAPSYTGLPVRDVFGTCQPEPGYYALDFAFSPYVCKAAQDGYTTICLSNYGYGYTSSSTADLTVEAISCPESRTEPRRLAWRGGTGGSECTDPARQCPSGSVATGVRYQSSPSWEWAKNVWLECRPVLDYTAQTLGAPTAVKPACGGTESVDRSYSCMADPVNNPSNDPAVMVGQRVITSYSTGWVDAVAPVCKNLRTGAQWTMTPHTTAGYDTTDTCLSNTEVYSLNLRAGDWLDGMQALCGDQVSLTLPYQGSSCNGYCNTYSGACWCDIYCMSYGDCCQDYQLRCTP